jgi:hypothetical protein
LTKKAKKRIRELCGLEGLSRTDRAVRSKELLEDDELKQFICHRLLGTTFRDIDKVLKEEIAASKIKSEEESIYEEMEFSQPEKLDPDHLPTKRKHKAVKRGYYTPEETLKLIEADSNKKWMAAVSKPREITSTWTPEEMWALINCCYDLRNFPR